MAEFISYPSKAIFSIVIFVSLFIQCAFCQGTLSGIEVTNGASSLSGTPVQTNANGIPTLIYNCAKLPSICNNVNKIITLVSDLKRLPIKHHSPDNCCMNGLPHYIPLHDLRSSFCCHSLNVKLELTQSKDKYGYCEQRRSRA